MAQRLTVHRDGEAIYDIVMEPDFNGLGPEVEKLGLSERKICLVTDSNVAALYLDEVAEILSKCCKTVLTFVFPAGEEHKNLDTVRCLYEHLILNHFDRKDLMAALGGGWWATYAASPRPPICGVWTLSRFPPRCCPRWIPAWAARPAWILTLTRTWWEPFTCPSWSTPIWQP